MLGAVCNFGLRIQGKVRRLWAFGFSIEGLPFGEIAHGGSVSCYAQVEGSSRKK